MMSACLRGLGNGKHGMPIGFRRVPGLARPQSHDHIHAGFFHVQGMGVSLAAVADHRHFFPAQGRHIGVSIIINRCWHLVLVSLDSVKSVSLDANEREGMQIKMQITSANFAHLDLRLVARQNR